MSLRQNFYWGRCKNKSEDNPVISNLTPDDEYFQYSGEDDGQANWTGILPDNGDHEITVSGPRANAIYRISISVQKNLETKGN